MKFQRMLPWVARIRSVIAWKGETTKDGVVEPAPPAVIRVPLNVFHPKFSSGPPSYRSAVIHFWRFEKLTSKYARVEAPRVSTQLSIIAIYRQEFWISER